VCDQGVFHRLRYKGKRTGIAIIAGHRDEMGYVGNWALPKNATVFCVGYHNPNRDDLLAPELYDATTLSEAKRFGEWYFRKYTPEWEV